MHTICRNVIAVLVMSVLLLGLSGCKKKEGPLERAGRKIDETAKKGAEQVEKAGKEIEENVTDK